MLKKYKGFDVRGNAIRWTSDTTSDIALELWKQDARVVRITENGKQIWRRQVNRIIKYTAISVNNESIFEFAVNEANSTHANKAVVDQKLAMWKRNNKVLSIKKNGKQIWKRQFIKLRSSPRDSGFADHKNYQFRDYGLGPVAQWSNALDCQSRYRGFKSLQGRFIIRRKYATT